MCLKLGVLVDGEQFLSVQCFNRALLGDGLILLGVSSGPGPVAEILLEVGVDNLLLPKLIKAGWPFVILLGSLNDIWALVSNCRSWMKRPQFQLVLSYVLHDEVLVVERLGDGVNVTKLPSLDSLVIELIGGEVDLTRQPVKAMYTFEVMEVII